MKANLPAAAKILLLLLCGVLAFGCSQQTPESRADTGDVAGGAASAGDVVDGAPTADRGAGEEIYEAAPGETNGSVLDEEAAGNSSASEEKGNGTAPVEASEPEIGEEAAGHVTWMFREEWKPDGTPPECPDPLILQAPVDIGKATSILYPGQVRGGEYKPHGGFRFDNAEGNGMEIRAPLDGYVTRGSRYMVGGEVQYLFDIINPCGIMYRFGHLRTLAPKFAQLAEKFSPPVEGDSRTTETETIPVQSGEIIATAVGFENNVFVDWGVYDLRQKNSASENAAWAAEHVGDQAQYALCWLGMLAPEASAKVKALPGADGVRGKQSDYCK
jgi:hypothetical protein